MTKNFFELFALAPTFNIDLGLLEAKFRKIQSESHPDRFVSAAPSEQLQAMQLATIANEAYQTLKSPSQRARYLLSLQGIEAIAETNTAMPADFLMQQMEWREAAEEAKFAKNISALEALLDEMQQATKTLTNELTVAIDQQQDFQAAISPTRQLIFIQKVRADIHTLIEQLET